MQMNVECFIVEITAGHDFGRLVKRAVFLNRDLAEQWARKQQGELLYATPIGDKWLASFEASIVSSDLIQ